MLLIRVQYKEYILLVFHASDMTLKIASFHLLQQQNVITTLEAVHRMQLEQSPSELVRSNK